MLKRLHDELDAAVLDAYGWHDLIGQPASDATLLERLVALNTQRRAEEAQGHICWLRPEFQDPGTQTTLLAASSPNDVTPAAATELRATPVLATP